MNTRLTFIIVLFFFLLINSFYAQSILITEDLKIESVLIRDRTYTLKQGIPLISFEADVDYKESGDVSAIVQVDWLPAPSGMQVRLTNKSLDTITLKNVLPFGTRFRHVYITGIGDHPLSRTHLFIPDQSPLNIIVPDDAWNLGYASMPLQDSFSLYALTKRNSWDKAIRKRFETILYPSGSVTYDYYVDTFSGNWQNGLRKCFQTRKLYDLSTFNSSLYHRPDLQWIKQAKMMHLIMAWDDKLYDRKKNKYVLKEFIEKSKKWYGGDDVIGIWPTWPVLGIDTRNQWDMYRDMPGGLLGLRAMIDQVHHLGTKIFISYNPWDESTRKEDHLRGMAALVKALDADGVILDTRGASSKELQETVDHIKPGVVMYSEGMAVPKDMETIISGRVHNALYYPPLLNLNKLIQPDFNIFRVTEIYKEPIRREIHTALFNGYGIEFNIFHPGNPEGLDAQYRYTGKIIRILREHSIAFNDQGWIPLYPSFRDSIYINHWSAKHKDLFTIYNYHPAGYNGVLFSYNKSKQGHWVDLWNHVEITPDAKQNSISVQLDPYPLQYQNTNNEGSVGVIARFDTLLDIKVVNGDDLSISASTGTHIMIWPEQPDYEKQPYKMNTIQQHIKLHRLFPNHDSKFIIQLFDDRELLDERVISINPATPYKTTTATTSLRHDLSSEMVLIPSDTFNWIASNGDEFIPYPKIGLNKKYYMKSFYMDRHPVTNTDYYEFIRKSSYKPKDNTNYLKHWVKGKVPRGLEHHPVIYISSEDALAYCQWSGKRLPSELEWQYAAQTAEQRTWPWGNEAGIKGIYSNIITETLTHIQYTSFDSTLANPGNNVLDPVGQYPDGKNAFGLQDLVGSVWQMTADQYRAGSYEYIILKGGSYYKPTSSWWYVQGGPRPLSWRQMWLKVDQGFERNGTVGFRGVRDK